MAEKRRSEPPAAVLFDLDGTLIDTAPDMAAALAEVCARRSLDPPDYALARASVSNGGMGLLRLAMPDYAETTLRSAVLPEFLATYERRIARESRLFAGMDRLLGELAGRGVPWGIVTNKPFNLSAKLIDALALTDACQVLLGGDSLSARKPDPEPLRHAAERIGTAPGACVYVGDNRRDIEAGAAAGMQTIAAAWGYILPGDDIHAWQADLVLDTPGALVDWLNAQPWAA